MIGPEGHHQEAQPTATVDFLPGTSADIKTVDAASLADSDVVIVHAGTDASATATG